MGLRAVSSLSTSALNALYVLKAGDTMTGNLALSQANARVTLGSGDGANAVFMEYITASNSMGLQIGRNGSGSDFILRNVTNVWQRLQRQTSGFAQLWLNEGQTIPAAGLAGHGLFFSSSSIGIMYGSGAPTASAAKGSLYLRSDGTTTNDRMYVNTNGSTTWTAVTTAA